LAAFGSTKGGSSLIIDNQGKGYRCIISLDVVIEALSKVEKFKTSEKEMKDWIKDKNILVIQSPKAEEKAKFDNIVFDRKDRHVLAAAKEIKADFLLSLDRKHIVTAKVKNSMKPTKVLTPKEFLQKKPIKE
jgi:predicted nucleic acid-binding protein